MAETVKKAKAPAKAPAKPRKTAAKAEATETKPVAHEEIARLAHHYWKERGGHHGSHESDWLRAEQELRGKAS